MIKVSDVVASIVQQSLEASLMLSRGTLNLSAYGKQILPEVERHTKKPVKLGSIVIALSRLSKNMKAMPELLPPPTALEVSARSGLMEVVFERTQKNLELFHLVQKKAAPKTVDFFVGTQGIAEITMIMAEDWFPLVEKIFKGVEPKFILRSLAALTLRCTEKDIFVPNVFFSTLYPFAMRRLNIVEFITTFTEMTLIFEEKDVQEGFEILKTFLGRRGKV
jgi:hypothetical protein